MFALGPLLQNMAAYSGSPAPWTPLSLGTALVGWYDFSDATTMFTNTVATVNVSVNGDEIQRINDKSGNGYYCIVNGGAGTGPVYNTGGYGTFNGTSQRLVSNSTSVPIASAAGYSAGVATYFNNNTGLQLVLDADNFSGGTRLARLASNNAGVAEALAINAAATLAFTDDAASITAAAAHVIVSVISTSAIEIFLDGTSNGSTAVTDTLQTAAGAFTIGAYNSGSSSYLNGRLYEAIIVNRPLTTGERASMTTWLGSKCGLVL